MRIMIESTEQGGVMPPPYTPTPPAHVETMDGGVPSETLLHAVAEALPMSTEREGIEGIDGGSPPEWLVEAIQKTSRPSAASSGMDIDAGSAPTNE